MDPYMIHHHIVPFLNMVSIYRLGLCNSCLFNLTKNKLPKTFDFPSLFGANRGPSIVVVEVDPRKSFELTKTVFDEYSKHFDIAEVITNSKMIRRNVVPDDSLVQLFNSSQTTDHWSDIIRFEQNQNIFNNRILIFSGDDVNLNRNSTIDNFVRNGCYMGVASIVAVSHEWKISRQLLYNADYLFISGQRSSRNQEELFKLTNLQSIDNFLELMNLANDKYFLVIDRIGRLYMKALPRQ
jgi:hypothetical protein